MAYAVRSDLEKRVGADRVASLADHDNDGAETPEAVDNAIAEASARMDGWLSGVLDTPLDTTEYPVLRGYAVSIALWLLALGKGADPDGEEAGLKADHDEAMRFLMKVGEGKLRLNKESAAAPGAIKIKSRTQKYTETLLETF
ncbi:MAG: DUF1320 domain-containing protein [Candidatus Glassbacteria bacterium]|nr:DUF1320 domain-containing protein [Candidatus Glassbacteria bacterium]